MRPLKWELNRRHMTHLIITVQLYYWLSENPSVKIWSNKFQMVMINYSKLCASLWENLISEFSVNWAKVKFEGCIQSFMLPWKLRKCQILPVNQNLSSIYFPLAKFQLVSCNPSLATIWQMTYTQKLPKLCSATLSLKICCLHDQYHNMSREKLYKKGLQRTLYIYSHLFPFEFLVIFMYIFHVW